MTFLRNTHAFVENPQIGKTRRELDRELAETGAETSKRSGNRLDTEDQLARADNLREARGRIN